MDEEYGSNYISLTDDNGEEYVFEFVDTVDYNGSEYYILLPADMDEDDPEFGYIIMENTKDGEDDYLVSIEDSIAEKVYDIFMQELYAEDEEETDGDEEGAEEAEDPENNG